VSCPDCGTVSRRVHAWHERTVADVPVDARKVAVVARLRRLRCQNLECGRRTFHEQVPEVLECYQRRTVRLAAQLGAVVRELAGPAPPALLHPRTRPGQSRRHSRSHSPFHNGRTEGVNTKTKQLMRQMYGRAGFPLLRHRILLGSGRAKVLTRSGPGFVA
jgi:transposase